MAAEEKIDLGVVPQYLPERQPEKLAVIAVEQRISPARDDCSAVHAQAELIGAQLEILAQARRSSVGDLHDVAKPQPSQVLYHAQRRHLGDQDRRFGVEQLLERRSVKVVPMQMR